MISIATIKDIAQLVGVSSATVSRVLNYDKELSVGDDTKKKIFQAAEDLNYTKYKKNQPKAPHTLRLVQWFSEQEELEDIYYLSIRLGIERKAEELKIPLIKESLEELSEKEADGTIALGKFDSQQVQQLAELPGKLLFVDFDALALGQDSLVVDFAQSVDLVINQFLAEGHQKIGILTGDEFTKGSGVPIEDPRYHLFQQRMEQNALFNPDFVLHSHFTVEDSYTQMKTYLQLGKELPTALFASSDALAVGALRALQEQGIQVPKDISIIGFNDISVAKYVSPPLSTIKVYTEWLGELAVETIIDLQKDTSPVPRKITIGTELINRSSTRTLAE